MSCRRNMFVYPRKECLIFEGHTNQKKKNLFHDDLCKPLSWKLSMFTSLRINDNEYQTTQGNGLAILSFFCFF